MVGINMTIQGLGKSTAILKSKSNKVMKLATKGIHEAGYFVESEVVESIAGHRAEQESVDTGNFKNSIKVDNSKKKQSKISTNLKYAPGLEFGTSKMQGRKHFKNTMVRNKAKITEFVNDEVKRL